MSAGLHFQVAVENNRDIICHSWVLECVNAKALLPIRPRHYLFQSPTTRKNQQTVIDMYGDPWFGDVDTQDLQKILTGINGEDPVAKQGLRQKLIKSELSRDWFWDLLKGCYFYFHKPLHSVNPDSQTLANMTLTRLRLSAEMLGASMSCDIMLNTTHVIVYMPLESIIPLRRLLQSLKQSKKVLSESPHINIVSHSWLEDCLRKKERLCIKPYLLRDGVHPSNNSDSGRSESRVVDSWSSKRRQCSIVIELDENESPGRETTHSTNPVEGISDRRKRQCKGFLQSSKCVASNEGLSPIQDPADCTTILQKKLECVQHVREAGRGNQVAEGE
ncbi:hypothetical protein L7F22_001500 [Adiantum nelumboides]|nr:hypothetical protein [Adiantum nelumboides]